MRFVLQFLFFVAGFNGNYNHILYAWLDKHIHIHTHYTFEVMCINHTKGCSQGEMVY